MRQLVQLLTPGDKFLSEVHPHDLVTRFEDEAASSEHTAALLLGLSVVAVVSASWSSIRHALERR